MFITGLMLYLCWSMVKPLVSVVLWSSILVIIFFPLYKNLLKRTKRHYISAIVTILISILTFTLPLVLISSAAVNELGDIAEASFGKAAQIINDPNQSGVRYVYDYINRYVNITPFFKPEDLKGIADKVKEVILQASWYFLGGLVGTFVSIFFAIFTMYYLFRDGEKIISALPDIMPLDNDQAKELIKETSELIDATLKGSLFVALIQGILAGLIFWILQIPSPILLGLLTMIFSLIPIGGTAFVTGPAIIILAISGDFVKAIILLAYACLVVGMIDNFLLPKLVKKRAKMHELFVFFSVIGGIQLFGILGLFMGPIILAISLGLLTVFRGEKISKSEITVK
jgi:predicted PurR-regulated permease PerM